MAVCFFPATPWAHLFRRTKCASVECTAPTATTSWNTFCTTADELGFNGPGIVCSQCAGHCVKGVPRKCSYIWVQCSPAQQQKQPLRHSTMAMHHQYMDGSLPRCAQVVCIQLVPQVGCLECLAGLVQVQDAHVRERRQVQAGGANDALGWVCSCWLASQVVHVGTPELWPMVVVFPSHCTTAILSTQVRAVNSMAGATGA